MTSKNSWIGAQGETLATCVLSRVALVTQVRREADVGIDLLCTLTTEEHGYLHAGRTFGVQVKTVAKGQRVKRLGLGGCRKQSCRAHQVRRLFDQDTPLFFAVVNLENSRVRLYSTLPTWHVRWQHGYPNRLILAPELPVVFDDHEIKAGVTHYRRAGGGPEECCNGNRHTLGLGPPIVDIALKDSAHDFGTLVGRCLRSWVHLGHESIRLRRSDCPYIIVVDRWSPNAPPEMASIWERKYASRNPAIARQNEIGLLRAITPIVNVLEFQWKEMASTRSPSLRGLITVLKEERLWSEEDCPPGRR